MKKPFRYQSWSSDQELLDRIDRIKFENGDMNKDEELRYNSTLGKFQKGDKFGSLSDFKNDPKLFEPILDNLKKPNKYKKFAEENNIRNHVWNKVLKNRQQKKRDYEGLSGSDIVVAEDKRDRLKKLNKQIAETNAVMEKAYEVKNEPVAQEKEIPIEQRISEWAKANPQKKNPMKNTIFGTDTFYLRKKGLLDD